MLKKACFECVLGDRWWGLRPLFFAFAGSTKDEWGTEKMNEGLKAVDGNLGRQGQLVSLVAWLAVPVLTRDRAWVWRDLALEVRVIR